MIELIMNRVYTIRGLGPTSHLPPVSRVWLRNHGLSISTEEAWQVALELVADGCHMFIEDYGRPTEDSKCFIVFTRGEDREDVEVKEGALQSSTWM